MNELMKRLASNQNAANTDAEVSTLARVIDHSTLHQSPDTVTDAAGVYTKILMIS
ncbi:hypothetical protein D3C87_2128920 [compost metagenome]